MNREIKFRAWDKIKSEWLLGYEMPSLGGFSIMGEMMMMGEYASLLSSYFPDNLENIILMQYTGLKDKNGVEIYEGDVCWDDHAEYHGKVVFEDGAFRYHWDNANELLDDMNISIEVIGNIYENPELLK